MSRPKRTIWFKVGINSQLFEHETKWSPEHIDFIASDCAEYYYSNCDGWEDHWPLTFTLYDEESAVKPAGVFTISLELEPSFYATEMKEGSCGTKG